MRKRKAKALNLDTPYHLGNGATIKFEDVLSYFKGKSIEVREQAFEAIRAMSWSRPVGRPRNTELHTQ